MRQSGDTERRILQAATEVFVRRGKDGARMQEIAEQAGINKALLHYYFRSKDHLYEEVFAREFGTFLREFLAAIPETGDLQEFLQGFIRHHIDRLGQHPALLRFVSWEIWRGGPTFGKILHERLPRGKGNKYLLIEMIERAVHHGTLRQVDPVQAALSLIGMCVYPFLFRPILEKVFPGLDVMSPRFLEQRKEEIFRLVWDGIRAPARARKKGEQ